MIGKNLKINESINPNSREISKLKFNFPNFFDKNGEFLLDRFKEMLNQNNIKLNKEGYELKFLGKSYARYLSSTKTETFVSPYEIENNKIENINSDNIYIVGDNLDALKHLLGSYSGGIKCIYIDPPYNTGSDGFVYPDNFYFDAKKLSSIIGVEEDEAERIINLKGRSSHSAWMTFMYPRLILASELLSDDGLIFISVDDNEQSNLKLMCDEIFGEENFVATFIRKASYGEKTAKPKINKHHEYFNVYAKNKNIISENEIIKGEKNSYNNYKNPDNDPKGRWIKDSLLIKIDDGRKGLARYGVYNPYLKTTDYPPVYYDENDRKQWHYVESTFEELKKNGQVYFYKTIEEKGKSEYGFYIKKYIPTEEKYKNISTIFGVDNKFTNSKGTTEVDSLIGKNIFSYPKPTSLINSIVRSCCGKDDIILDFFSGSATTAHAVMQLNAEDNGNRKYILVQIPEKIKEDSPAYKEGYRTIDQIGRERIIRAANLIKNKTNSKVDYGFKTYSLESPTNEILINLEDFDETYLLDSYDMISMYKTEHSTGKNSILTTYLLLDGYGFAKDTERCKLDTFVCDKIGKSLYIIDEGMESEDVAELIRLIENNKLIVSRIVVYSSSLKFNVINELRNNLSNLRNNRNVELIERY